MRKFLKHKMYKMTLTGGVYHCEPPTYATQTIKIEEGLTMVASVVGSRNQVS